MDPMMQHLFHEIRGHLQELESSQKMTLAELDAFKQETNDNIDRLKADMNKRLDMMRNSTTMTNAATTALGGTFASIEQYLADLVAWKAKVDARLEALEKQQRPPAA